MASHLTPGAKALLKNRLMEALEVEGDRCRIRNKNGQTMWVKKSDLTPLISATITEDGKAREVNKHGDNFDAHVASWGEDEDPHDKAEEWVDAEASRRTWEVKWKESWSDDDGFWNFAHESPAKDVDTLLVFPGTPVLGYESPDGRFVIVEVGR